MHTSKAARGICLAWLLVVAASAVVNGQEHEHIGVERKLNQLWDDQQVTHEQITLTHQPSAMAPAVSVIYTVSYATNCSDASGLLGLELRRRCQKLPILFLLNGANVRAQDYSDYITLMVQRGYTFVASDYWHFIPGFPTPPASDQCPSGKSLVPSSALIKTFMDYAASSTIPALQRIQERGIVLFGHSLGGTEALTIFTNGCANTANPVLRLLCEAYQPTVQTIAPSSDGRCPDTSPTTAGLILGTVVYEGYLGSGYTQAPAGAAVPTGSFVLYLSGQYGANKTGSAYSQSTPSSCACVGLAVFEGVNHFGISNWQGGASQVTPCAIPASWDPPAFTCEQDFQAIQQKKMAAITDNFIRAMVFKEWLAQQNIKLRQAVTQTYADRLDYSLKLNGRCY